jgi:hypothetical protein
MTIESYIFMDCKIQITINYECIIHTDDVDKFRTNA